MNPFASFSSRVSSDKRRRLARYHRAHRLCEPLEPRQLLSVTTIAYSIQNDINPGPETYDASGNLWEVTSTADTGATVLQEIANQQPVANIDISNYSPIQIVAGPAGHIYMADLESNGIDDVNLTTGAVTPYSFSNSAVPPFRLTVSGNGDVWFNTVSPDTDQYDANTNIIGRWTPGSADADYFTLPASTSDSIARDITSAGNDAVWVGLEGTDDGIVNGANHIALVSFDGSAYTSTVYAVNSGNATSDANNYLASVTSDGSGGVWFALENLNNAPFGSSRTVHGPDMLVHGTLSGTTLNETGFTVPGGSGTTPLQVQSLSRDVDGRVWFIEVDNLSVGFFDPSNNSFDIEAIPAPSPLPDGFIPDQIAASPVSAEATAIATGFDFTQPATFFQIDVQNTVTFSGSASNLSAQEGTTFNNQLLATFTAPDLATGNYTATITWGDGTTSTVTATSLGDGLYGVVINGKSFATQGTYNSSIVITDPSASPVGTLTFQSVISDTPLDVTSFTGVNIFAGITAAAGSFTDDPGLPTGTWTATINWGDGTTSSAMIVQDPTQAGRYLIIGLHVYQKAGTYNLTLLVNTSEPDAAITSDSLTASVSVR